jgi:hypothetical protein
MSEYYLEYRAERHKEPDYLVSLKEDLKVDVIEISSRVLAIEDLKKKSLKLEKTLYKTVWSESDIDIWVQRGYASYYQIMIKIEQEKAKELIQLLEEELEKIAFYFNEAFKYS